jgi:hypothetical protein
VFAYVFAKEPQHEVTVFLQQNVFAPIAPIGFRVGQMLTTVKFDGNARPVAKQVDFHVPPTVKGNRQLGVEAEEPPRLRERFKPSEKECLGGTASTLDAFRVGRHFARCVNEQTRQGVVDAVANKPPHARRKFGFRLPSMRGHALLDLAERIRKIDKCQLLVLE